MSDSLVITDQAPAPALVREEALALVVIDRTQPVLVRDGALPVRVAQADSPVPPVVVHPAPAPQVVTTGFAGPRGPQGPQGDPGGSGTLSRPVGAVVQGMRIVRSEDGVIYPVDLAIEAHAGQVLGLGLQSVTVIGNPVNVQLAGPVTDSSWAWAPGPVWCGADGALTQAPAATGWLMVVGRAIEPTTVDIAIETPIYRG